MAAVCEDCIKGAKLEGTPKGTVQPDGTYFRPAPEGAAPSDGPKRAVVVLTDIFGMPLVNCKLIADHIAEQLGCDVWVPDQFEGV